MLIPSVLAQPSTQHDFDQEIKKIYNNPKIHIPDIAKKSYLVSQYFVGKPYLGGALGEGKNALFDQNPIYRTDKFDCVTFVATVLALAEANNLEQFQNKIKQINYKAAKVSFITRNHFMSVDWNPNNEKNGFLQDINKDILDENGQSIISTTNTLIDKPSWYKKRDIETIKIPNLAKEKLYMKLRKLHAYSHIVKAEVSQMSYIPLNKLFKNGVSNKKIFDQIPSGVIIEIVRPNWNIHDIIGTNLDVSHVGLGIRINNELIFRHASSLHKQVVDINLEQYLAEQRLKHPSIAGIRLEKIITCNN